MASSVSVCPLRSTNETLRYSDVSAKGIAGRAVFIDWYSWAQQQGRKVDAMSDYEIPFDELMQTLHHQGLGSDDIKPGDILFVRSGYISQYESMSDNRRSELHELYKTQKPQNIGVEASREFLKFLWDHKIAAVAGDSRSFEAWPCRNLDWHLHEWLLAGWGLPIGELFDLEELSKVAASKSRYSFFLASSPMNVCCGKHCQHHKR